MEAKKTNEINWDEEIEANQEINQTTINYRFSAILKFKSLKIGSITYDKMREKITVNLFAPALILCIYFGGLSY